jgi:hypothetical protein
MSEYEDKIKEMLNKVIKGEPVFKPEPEDKIANKIKEKGVKTVIAQVFNENYEVPSFIKEENVEETGQYLSINPPSSYKDCDEYWAKVSPYLKRLGVVNPHSESGVIEITNEGKIIKIKLVRDSKNGEKPSLMFESDIPPEQLIKMVEKCGLKSDRLSAKMEENKLIMDLIPC